MQHYNIVVIPGDGIGQEVCPEGMNAIKAVTRQAQTLTPDLGGSAKMVDVTQEIVAHIQATAK